MRLGLWLIACTVLWSTVSAAECAFPKAPEAVPNGKTAAESEMMSAMSTFKQYNSNVTTYLACLETDTADKIRDAGGSIGAIIKIKSIQSKKHNAAIDELQTLAGKFNEQVRNFKARK